MSPLPYVILQLIAGQLCYLFTQGVHVMGDYKCSPKSVNIGTVCFQKKLRLVTCTPRTEYLLPEAVNIPGRIIIGNCSREPLYFGQVCSRGVNLYMYMWYYNQMVLNCISVPVVKIAFVKIGNKCHNKF